MKQLLFLGFVFSLWAMIGPAADEPSEYKYIHPVWVEDTWHVSITVKNIAIKPVLDEFEQLLSINIVPDPGIKGTITCHLEDMHWRDALRALLRSNGLVGEWMSRNLLYVQPLTKAGKRIESSGIQVH